MSEEFLATWRECHAASVIAMREWYDRELETNPEFRAKMEDFDKRYEEAFKNAGQ